MDAFIFKFTAKQLRELDTEALGFLASSGHCCNELTALMPYIAFEHPLQKTNEVESAFILLRRYTIDRIIISKIVEYHELCEKFFSNKKIAPLDSFAELLKVEYGQFSEHIKAAPWARILRNKLSFHYDHSYAQDSLAKLDGEHPLRLITGKIKGLTLFEFSEEIVSRPVFELAGNGNIENGMQVVRDFILKALPAITTFHANSVISAFKNFGVITEREQTELREMYCGYPGVDCVPLSISTAYINSARLKD